MYEMLIPGLAFLAVIAIGGAILAACAGGRKRLRTRLPTPATPVTDSGQFSATPRSHGVLGNLGAKVADSGGPSKGLREKLAKAGYHARDAAAIFLGAKVLLLLVGVAGLGMLPLPADVSLPVRVFLVLAGATTLSFLPNLVVYLRRRKRRAEVRAHLPDVLDLLEISVSSGMGLDTAWNSVAAEIRGVSATLADEMALTNLELHLGAQRAVAMRHMADRTGAEDISSLVAVLTQSERFGTSVADALRTFAGSMRETRSTKAEVAAEKMAVSLLFPMVLFIFPTMLVVTVGPAAVVLVEMMTVP